MTVQAGAAVHVVDVPDGTAMAGFAARTGPSRGVLDPLTVRALVVDDVGLVTVDVCALHERTVALVRAGLEGQLRAVVVIATHTHSGPCVSFGRLGPHSEVVHDRILHAIIDAARRAKAQRRPCRIVYREGVPGVAKNRRHPERVVSPPAQSLEFVAADGDGGSVAWLVSYACHPVVLDATNEHISGDYPATVRDVIEEESPGAICLFATGAAGDLNTGHRVESSYAADTSGLRTHSEAVRIGGVVAGAVLRGEAVEVEAGRALFAVELVTIPIDRTAVEEASLQRAGWHAELAAGPPPQRAALLEAWIEWADAVVSDTLAYIGDAWEGSVAALALGGVILVFLPGEPFLRTAERLAAEGERVVVVGYANGCPGYFPPLEEMKFGGYEVEDAHRYYGLPGPFAAGSAELLEARARLAMAAVRS